jgi:hypothetical protein
MGGDNTYEAYRVKCPDREPARSNWGGSSDGDPTDGDDLHPSPVPADDTLPF